MVETHLKAKYAVLDCACNLNKTLKIISHLFSIRNKGNIVFKIQKNKHFRKNCQLIGKSCLTRTYSFISSLYHQNESIEIMKHSNTVQDAVWFIKEIFSDKSITKNSLNSKDEYCERHGIKDYYCETK